MLKLGGRGARANHVKHYTTAHQHYFSRFLSHTWLEMEYILIFIPPYKVNLIFFSVNMGTFPKI